MDSSSLQGVELKIARAKSHLADLEEAIKWTLGPDRYGFRTELDPKTGKHLLWVDPFPSVCPEWSIVIGEILFNLRSALDHLAHQLILLDGKAPTDETQFPIRRSPYDKKGNLMRIDLKPPIERLKILPILDELQPYRGDNGEIVPPDESPLWWLRELNNIDKHRLLLVVVCVLDIDKMWWDSPDTPAPVVTIKTCTLKEGTPIACFDFQGIQPPPEFNPHASLSIAINEADVSAIKLGPFGPVLGRLCEHIETDILGRFRPLF